MRARGLYEEASDLLRERALDRELVTDAIVRQHQPATDDAAAQLNAIDGLLKALGDKHARLVRAMPAAASPVAAATSEAKPGNGNASETKAPEQAPVQPRIPTVPESRTLGDVAYVLVPGCMPQSEDDKLAFARQLRDAIAAVAASNPRGYVIDVRLNGGGNVWPMLLGIDALLPDGALMAATDAAGATVQLYGVDASGAWLEWQLGAGVERQPQLAWPDVRERGTELAPKPVAVLLGPWTMSSGEALALCMLHDPRSKSFGERTQGLTTSTFPFRLADGSTLLLSTSRFAVLAPASAGTPQPTSPVVDSIEPMQPVAFGDWPTDDDATTQAALAWVRSQAAQGD